VIDLAIACGDVPCLPYGNYYFYSQADVDNFQTAFPNCTALQGNVTISGSDITNLLGLVELTSIGNNLSINSNTALISLTGLEGLTSIGGSFIFGGNNALVNLSGLNNLTSIGGNLEAGFNIWGSIFGNPAFTSLTGLDNLTSIGGYLSICFNDALTSLTGLEGLTSIGGVLEISNNDALTSLTGLDNIAAGSIIHLQIFFNGSLSTCDVQSICNYLASPNGTIDISINAEGCNSVEEVETACGFCLNENGKPDNRISIFPNPSSTQITISTPTMVEKNTFMTIYNISGQQLMQRQIMAQQIVVDVSGLSQGIYFVRMNNDRTVQVGKFVKQ
jgi:hypothetical protein